MLSKKPIIITIIIVLKEEQYFFFDVLVCICLTSIKCAFEFLKFIGSINKYIKI